MTPHYFCFIFASAIRVRAANPKRGNAAGIGDEESEAQKVEETSKYYERPDNPKPVRRITTLAKGRDDESKALGGERKKTQI